MLDSSALPVVSSRHRPASLLVVSVLDALGRWGLSIDTLTAAAAGVSLCPVGSASGAGRMADAVLTDPELLQVELSTAFEGLPIDAVKLGALLDPSAVDAVTDVLVEVHGDARSKSDAPSLVLDPGLFDQSGLELASILTAPAMVRRLLPLATVVTPSTREAAVLTGFPVGDRSSMRDACSALFDRGVAFPLVKAHLERHSIDIAYDGTGFVEFGTDRVPHRALGSGCAHSAAIAMFLAQGAEPFEAFDRAKTFVTGAVTAGLRRSAEMRVVNPLFGIYAAASVDVSRYELTVED